MIVERRVWRSGVMAADGPPAPGAVPRAGGAFVTER